MSLNSKLFAGVASLFLAGSALLTLGVKSHKRQDDWDPEYWLKLLSGPANSAANSDSAPAETNGRAGYSSYR